MSLSQLEIIFTNEQLDTIYRSGCKVIIGKYCPQYKSECKFNVTWQAFKPLGVNVITWEDIYGIYASTSELLEGSTLIQTSYSEKSAIKGRKYTLQDSGVISPPEDQLFDNSFHLNNGYKSKDLMTVGLCQKATINGETTNWNAISAMPVMLNHTIKMETTYRISIWLQSMVGSNTIFSRTVSDRTNIKFDSNTQKIRLLYDTFTGSFIVD